MVMDNVYMENTYFMAARERQERGSGIVGSRFIKIIKSCDENVIYFANERRS